MTTKLVKMLIMEWKCDGVVSLFNLPIYPWIVMDPKHDVCFVLFAAIPLSIDHKPDRSDERERIEQAGGFIIWAGSKFLYKDMLINLSH